VVEKIRGEEEGMTVFLIMRNISLEGDWGKGEVRSLVSKKWWVDGPAEQRVRGVFRLQLSLRSGRFKTKRERETREKKG